MSESISTYGQSTDNSNSKMLYSMVGIGVLCALLIVLTYEGTLPRIERLKSEALEKAIFKVIPGITETKAFQLNDNGTFTSIIEEENKNAIVYAGYNKKGDFLGIAVQASGQGYADIISVLYGYDPLAQKIVGFYVLESKETPGLGDKIEKDPSFQANFQALDIELDDNLKSLKNPVKTVKNGFKKSDWEIDGITGATISSRAIGNIINTSVNEMIPLIYKNIDDFKNKEQNE